MQAMIVTDPEELHRIFARRASEGDLDGLMELYEEGATYLGPDGEQAVGTRAIREGLKNLLEAAPQVTITNSRTILARDIALMFNRWQMRVGVAGSDTTAEGSSTEVARRQSDGSWLYVVDHPTIDRFV